MSGAMSLMIVSACLSFNGQGKEACEKALEAGSKQSGIEQNVNQAQDRLEDKAKKNAKDLLGDTTMDVVGGTVFLAKTISDKSVKFSLPTMGLCDKITNEVGPDKYQLQMVWRFK